MHRFAKQSRCFVDVVNLAIEKQYQMSRIEMEARFVAKQSQKGYVDEQIDAGVATPDIWYACSATTADQSIFDLYIVLHLFSLDFI